MLKHFQISAGNKSVSNCLYGKERKSYLIKCVCIFQLKKRGLESTDATYTALFNACAESPHKQAGLQQALKLEQELRRKNYPLSTITYHALLKTHAITNHLQACFHTLRVRQQHSYDVTLLKYVFLSK